jgi:hypothetical protein
VEAEGLKLIGELTEIETGKEADALRRRAPVFGRRHPGGEQ